MTKMTLLERCSVLLLDMNSTFMFGEDRFGPEQDFYATYVALGGSRLSSEKVNRAIRACYRSMATDYETPERFDDFPSLAEGLRRYGAIDECDVSQLEPVFSAHELGAIPSEYAALIQRLARTHELGLVANIWARKAPWIAELTRAGLADAFKVTVFSSDSRSIKPSPVLFREALRAFPPDAHVAFVGDSLRCDIIPAKALGLITAWINMSGASAFADYVLPNLLAIELA